MSCTYSAKVVKMAFSCKRHRVFYPWRCGSACPDAGKTFLFSDGGEMQGRETGMWVTAVP